MGERRGAYRIFVGKPEEKSIEVGGRIILKRMFKKWDGGHVLDSLGS
jgi:hypothetical protein